MSDESSPRSEHPGWFIALFVLGFLLLRFPFPPPGEIDVPWPVYVAVIVIAPFLIAMQIEQVRSWKSGLGEFLYYFVTSGGSGFGLGAVCSTLWSGLSGPIRWDILAQFGTQGLVFVLAWLLSTPSRVVSRTTEDS